MKQRIKILWSIVFIMLLIPFTVSAETEEKVAEATRYYKTVTVLSNSNVMRNANLGEITSITTEITEEEYESVDSEVDINEVESNISPGSTPNYYTSTTIETNYKKLKAEIYTGTNMFKYKVTLDWKKMPSTRSYDIIAIGYYATVRKATEVNLTQTYCLSSSECYETNGYYADSWTNGAAAVFKLPSGTLTSLKQEMQFYVEKVNATVYEQLAVGDYAHATSSISYAKAKLFTVDCAGINLDSSITSYYDSIAESYAEWEGTW